MVIRHLEYFDDIGHMGRKSRKALLNALLIPNIGQYVGKYVDLTAVKGRDHHPAHGHGTKKPQSFEGYCLSSCVRAGNDQSIKAFSNRDVGGYYMFRVNEGMACFDEVNNTIISHHWYTGFHFIGQTGFGKDDIQLDHCVVAV